MYKKPTMRLAAGKISWRRVRYSFPSQAASPIALSPDDPSTAVPGSKKAGRLAALWLVNCRTSPKVGLSSDSYDEPGVSYRRPGVGENYGMRRALVGGRPSQLSRTQNKLTVTM
jgi:hypothetical protein